MPRTSLLRAIKTRYETVVSPDWPAFWSGRIKPGQARVGYPCFLCVHRGDTPRGFQQIGGDRPVATLRRGLARLSFFAETEESADALALALQDLMEGSPVEIRGDDNVWLEQVNYTLGDTNRTGPHGEFVFEAATVYQADWNPGPVEG